MLFSELAAQGAHRRGIEEKLTRAAIISERVGQVFGLVVGLSGIASATYLIANEHDLAGTVVFGIDIGALAALFVYGRYTEAQSAQREGEADR